MKLYLHCLFLLSLASTSLAKIGDKCGWAEKKGICKEVPDCTSGNLSIVSLP
jgi:hypothetical protein